MYVVSQSELTFLYQESKYVRTLEQLRSELTEFRNKLSQSDQLPPHYPIPKLSITRMNAPNGIPTLRISFNCPSFIQTPLILGEFVASLQNSDAAISIEVQASENGSAKNSHPPFLNFILCNGNGSFHMLPNIRSGTILESTFVFYRDEFLSSAEINAVVDAYKALFSDQNVAAFKRESMLRSRVHPRHQKQESGLKSKESAIEQLQSLGLEVYNSKSEDESALNWDSLVP